MLGIFPRYNLPSGTLPNVQSPKQQLPKGDWTDLGKYLWKIAAWDIAFGKVPNIYVYFYLFIFLCGCHLGLADGSQSSGLQEVVFTRLFTHHRLTDTHTHHRLTDTHTHHRLTQTHIID